MEKEFKIKKSNLPIVIILIVILLILSAASYFSYYFYSKFQEKQRFLETGDNVKEAAVKEEKVVSTKLYWDSNFDMVVMITYIFYDDKNNEYDYITYDIKYGHEISSKELGLESFSNIKGVYAEFEYKNFYHPNSTSDNSTNSSTQDAKSLHSSNPINFIISLIRKYL